MSSIRNEGSSALSYGRSPFGVRRYLAATLTAIVNGHKQSRIDELLLWNFRPQIG